MPSPSNRPVIGIPTQNLQSIGGVSPEIPPSWVMSDRYVDSLTTLGATPWLIPLVDDATLRAIYERLDGVFLPGGADVDPASYDADRDAACDRSDPPRDRRELALVRWAMADEKRVLGVCRGLQIINLAAGGTLVQDLGSGRAGSMKHDYFPYRDGHARDFLAHTVRVTEGTRLHRILVQAQVSVNSMHHQGVDRLGHSLAVNAVAPDGLVEGLEGADDAF